MKHYSPYGHKGGGKTFFALILGIVIGIAAGYFGNIYITETFAYFPYKSMIIGAAAGVITALMVNAIASAGHNYQ